MNVYSDEAHGYFTEWVSFCILQKTSFETSVSIANLWKEEFFGEQSIMIWFLFNLIRRKAWSILLFADCSAKHSLTWVEKWTILSRLPRTICRDLLQVPMKPWLSIFNHVKYHLIEKRIKIQWCFSQLFSW